MVFGLFRRKPKYAPLWEPHERVRFDRAMFAYDPYMDRPIDLHTEQGAVTFRQTPGSNGMSGSFHTHSPMVAMNNTSQLAFGQQASNLANEGNQILQDPNQAQMYKAFQGKLDTAYNQARGQAAARYASNQNSAFGRILGNKEFYQVAQERAAQPYTFLGSIVNPLAQQAINNQAGLQQVNDSVYNNLNRLYSMGQNAQDNKLTRAIHFQDSEFERLERDRANRFNWSQGQINNNAQWRSNMFSGGSQLAGAILGGVFGGPAGAMAGAQIGQAVGGFGGNAMYPNAQAQQMPQATTWNQNPYESFGNLGSIFAKNGSLFSGKKVGTP